NYEREHICELMNTSLAGEVTLPCGDSSTESGCFLRSHLAPVHRLCAD
ncbi:MAG: L-asparaginase 1, partial [Alloprevotella sp.]